MKTLLTITMLIVPTAADPMPICDSSHEGALACMANKACVCQFVPNDATRPARYTWDCGINRPMCEMPPADLPPQAATAPAPAAAASRAVPAEVIVPVRPPKPRHQTPPATRQPAPKAEAKPAAPAPAPAKTTTPAPTKKAPPPPAKKDEAPK